jgi:hypothetical protein
MEPNDVPTLHLYVLLDRSGSMSSMAADVVEGFNTLLAEQATAGGAAARMTFVQFDDTDPQEVLTDAIPLAEVAPLSMHSFVPRGSTPLLDATGRLIGKAMTREKLVAGAESIVFATITDGHENASSEFTLADIKKLIDDRAAAGWTFVYLGADPTAYGEAGALGYDVRSTQHFAADGDGAKTAFSELGRGMSSRRAKLAEGRSFDKDDFFEGEKRADDDRSKRRRS